MTIDDFLELIAGDDWRLEGDFGYLRDDNGDCPLWHAYRLVDPDEDGDAEDHLEVGRRIGLSHVTSLAIAAAADNRGNPRLRARLLAAAGAVAPPPRLTPPPRTKT